MLPATLIFSVGGQKSQYTFKQFQGWKSSTDIEWAKSWCGVKINEQIFEFLTLSEYYILFCWSWCLSISTSDAVGMEACRLPTEGPINLWRLFFLSKNQSFPKPAR